MIRKILASAAACALSMTAMAVSGEKIVVGFSQIGAESAWRTAETISIKTEAEKRGIELIFSDAQQKQENQIKALRNFIAMDVDVIGLAPVVESGWEPVLREVQEAGIPVILVDRKVNVSDESLYESYLGPNVIEEGRNAARWLAERMNGKANIVELQGTVGSAPAIERKQGFEGVIADYPGMRIVMSQSGDFTRAKGKEVMEQWVKSPDFRSVDAIFAHNDDMALGAVQALEESGFRPGKDIVIVSIDGVRDAFVAMVDGKLNCTVECNPLLGPQFFNLVEKLAAGGSIPRWEESFEDVYDETVAAKALPERLY
ncbi:MAG: ABC transporter substrate-binding protein [Planctomycetota bacterium]|jgi:simple sugar transport system substrate-binding protein|nr:ABC transporter substrate-binding protein [Planctomycetota bacterium]